MGLDGHAILSPSYRVTFETARRVYCRLPIKAGDTQALVLMTVALERRLTGKFADAQLIQGGRFLLFLLGQPALEVFPPRQPGWDDQAWQSAKNLREDIAQNSADPAMIWHPRNPQYPLRGGC